MDYRIHRAHGQVIQSPLAPPPEFGAPAHFPTWRGAQAAAFTALLNDRRRFQSLTLPTGVGKSLVGITYAKFEGGRSMYLTATKGLQDQLTQDFAGIGLTDVRGMSNYECLEEGGVCSDGSCTEGMTCVLKAGGCLYYDAVRKAEIAQIASSNYAWWFTRKATFQAQVEPLDLLICDEAHLIAEEMSGYLSVRLSPKDVDFPDNCESWGHQQWRDWAKIYRGTVNLGRARNKHERRRLKELKERLNKLENMEDDWIFERSNRGGAWTFDPLWPTKYLEAWLWRGAKKVILVSATVRPKTLSLLGVPDAHFIEYDSPIPVSRRPVYYTPAARINYTTDETGLWRWVEKMDGIIDDRLDRKGIIHAVSYDRARYIKENSRHSGIMLIHDTQSARDTIAAFKQMPAPAVLVSPSVTTGYDFPYDEARYQIIAKVPFQPPSALLKARTQADKLYPYYLAIMTMVQAAGRVCRGPEDSGETFIVDEMAGWLRSKYGQFAPRWFLKAWSSRDQIPKPPRLV